MKDNKINTYTCESCGFQIVTIDRDEGVTPMFTACDKCGGRSMSSWYRCDQALTPTHEWIQLTPKQIKKLPSAWRSHYEKGGLDLKVITS